MTQDGRQGRRRLPHEQRHERELEALYEIAQILSQRAGQREILTEVLDVLRRNLGMVRGTLLLLSTDGSELHIEAARDVDGPGRRVSYRPGEGITGRVFETARAAIIPRISEEPKFNGRIHGRSKADAEDLSFICVPILLGKEVVGTLAVDLPYEPQAELVEDERVLSIVSAMIANDVRSRRADKLQREAAEAENMRLREQLGQRFRPENIIGKSKAMREVYTRIHQVARSETTVLIRGESGTGKELVASAVHYSSPRAGRPFVKVNCAALSEGLLESELFGHEKGAFTGAIDTRVGRIEQAQGGTLFLDEIGDFSPAVQVKLLRVLQEREFQRVGSNQTHQADVRIIAATNRDLDQAVKDKSFRADLYYRINVFPIHLPPLRDRREDILLLADHFAETYAGKMDKVVRRISTPAINMMMAYHWPGNVRELENCIEHAVLLSSDGVIHGRNLPPTLQTPDAADAPPPGELKARIQLLERDMIMDALKRSSGNVSAAARELGITPRMVRYKIDKLGIDYQRFFKKRN
jgi:Nif-specific regulatory protein